MRNIGANLKARGRYRQGEIVADCEEKTEIQWVRRRKWHLLAQENKVGKEQIVGNSNSTRFEHFEFKPSVIHQVGISKKQL